VSAASAERELQRILVEIDRGVWQQPSSGDGPPRDAQRVDFRTFAEQWWLTTAPLIAKATQRGYRWRLERHLLPYFAGRGLDEITPEVIERYVDAKLAERRPLSTSSINMTVTLLGAILESAVERELIATNPARVRRLRLPERKPEREHLERAAQIEALLDAASELDHEAPPSARHVERQAMLATLTFAGLRIGELCGLRWRDVDLANGWLTVVDAKAEGGIRRVAIRAALGDQLREVRARNRQAPSEALVFPTRRGGRQDAHNFRARVLLPAIERANLSLAERGRTPMPGSITLLSLRRTFATVLCVLGEDPMVALDELGDSEPGPTLAVYRQARELAAGEKERLRALVEGSKSPWFRGEGEGSTEISEVPPSAARGGSG
jgi:integrase